MQFNPGNTFDLILHELFDYAGMFPPAAKSFEEALHESSSFPSSLHRPWMIASDIVLDTTNARRLLTLKTQDYGFSSALRVCLLATEPNDKALSLAKELSAGPVGATVTAIEIKAEPEAQLTIANSYLRFSREKGVLVGIEPDLSKDNWQESLESSIKNLRAMPTKVALKCRLTGPTGITPKKLSAAIVATADAQLPLKITGGLHHPIVERARYEFSMGFLNVGAAVMLRRALGATFTNDAIISLLTNEEKNALSFGPSLSFKSFSASIEQVRNAKGIAPFAIGSCSLHEPDADLTRLFGDT